MKNLLVLLFIFTFTLSYAQPARQAVQVIVTPDKEDWTYEKGNSRNSQLPC